MAPRQPARHRPQQQRRQGQVPLPLRAAVACQGGAQGEASRPEGAEGQGSHRGRHGRRQPPDVLRQRQGLPRRGAADVLAVPAGSRGPLLRAQGAQPEPVPVPTVDLTSKEARRPPRRDGPSLNSVELNFATLDTHRRFLQLHLRNWLIGLLQGIKEVKRQDAWSQSKGNVGLDFWIRLGIRSSASQCERHVNVVGL